MEQELDHLKLPRIVIQPILAKEGKPSIDPARVAKVVAGVAEVRETIVVRDAKHWESSLRRLDPAVDVILPVSIPCYPTEIWNAHPEPLRRAGRPVLFWPLVDFDEPDFWKWSCSDMFRSLGIEVELPRNQADGLDFLRALALKKWLRTARMLVFGEQNFPWNANAVGGHFTASLGVEIEALPMSAIYSRMKKVSAAETSKWRDALYGCKTVSTLPEELDQALHMYAAIRALLIEHRAMAFGVNCFGDLIPSGGRVVPCLAQHLARQEGFIASCDGDFCAMMSMVFLEKLTGQPSMMSNMYPLNYVGALTEHFGSPLAPAAKWKSRKNLARLAHCGFVGVVPPTMTPRKQVLLKDWGGTYEIKRDGRGCGLDGDLRGGERFTAVEFKFDGKTLLLTGGKVLETTRHRGMSHCESSALLEFDDLPAFIEVISREHVALSYGNHIDTLLKAARVIGLNPVKIPPTS